MVRRLFWFAIGLVTGAALTVRRLGRGRLGRVLLSPDMPQDVWGLSADVLAQVGRRLGDYGRS